jgi:hypothetical protein
MTVLSILPFTPTLAPRYSLRDQPSRAGEFVDGGWWPRSRDLAVELPVLLDVLWAAGRVFTRISYNLTVWDAAPRKAELRGRVLHFDGFRLMDPLLVRLADADSRDRLDLVVIPPEAPRGLGARALAVAGRHRDAHTTAEIVALTDSAGLRAALSSPRPAVVRRVRTSS